METGALSPSGGQWLFPASLEFLFFCLGLVRAGYLPIHVQGWERSVCALTVSFCICAAGFRRLLRGSCPAVRAHACLHVRAGQGSYSRVYVQGPGTCTLVCASMRIRAPALPLRRGASLDPASQRALFSPAGGAPNHFPTAQSTACLSPVRSPFPRRVMDGRRKGGDGEAKVPGGQFCTWAERTRVHRAEEQSGNLKPICLCHPTPSPTLPLRRWL